MSEPFDPNIALRPAADGLPAPTTEMDPPAGLTTALTSQRQAFSGLEALPIDEPELPGQELEPPANLEAEPPPDAVTLPLEPAAPAIPQASPEIAALQAQMALLQAELAASRVAQQPPYVPPTPQAPPTLGTDIYDRITDRFQQNFAAISEQRADESETDFERRRARSFAETIVAAVYEDLLPTDAVQARFQPTAERVAQSVAERAVRNDRETNQQQSALDTMIAQAVATARAAGYNVHPPVSTDHGKSQESVLFWDWAAKQVDQGLPIDQQITKALALMPQKAPATPPPVTTPPTPHPRPMARQGAVPVPQAGGTDEYQPMDMHSMLGHHAGVRRVGVA